MLSNNAEKLGTAGHWTIRVMTVEEVSAFWPDIEEALDDNPELWNQYYTKESIFEDVAKGHLHIIAAAKDETIVMVTMCAVVTWPAGKRLKVFFMAGEGLEECGILLDHALEHFANMTGCLWIDGYGRRGFERFTKQFGYRFVNVQVTRPVNQRRH